MATGSLTSEALPEIATDALVCGLDSPSLRMLAGQPPTDVRDSTDLFRAALDELGIDLPDAETAHWALVRQTLSGVVAGLTNPGRGASELWPAYQHVRDSGDLRIFIGLDSQLEDHPEDRAEIESQITAEAKDFLARGTPRTWIKLMAAVGHSPLTRTDGGLDTEVDPEEVGISQRLSLEVRAWAGKYAAVFGGRPQSRGFKSPEEVAMFVAEGKGLVARLQDELGPSHVVEYMPEPTQPPGVKLRKKARLWLL